ncbi:MAG: hypothetical protein E7416_03470 [Ruminococcaceae bacterium]|nr:hypothetical protein [Oscillospiraceae bacterium]
MKRASTKERIIRSMKRHLLFVRAEFFRRTYDGFGDISAEESIGEYDIYFSQLLHRYSPYVDLDIGDDGTVKNRTTPMALLVAENPEIAEGDIVRIKNLEYTVCFCENVKDFYYLLSLAERGRDD